MKYCVFITRDDIRDACDNHGMTDEDAAKIISALNENWEWAWELIRGCADYLGIDVNTDEL